MEPTDEDLAQKDTLVKDDPELWDDFEEHIKMAELEDLTAMADRLGLSEQTSWQDYAELFSGETWADVIEAYEHCTYEKY